MIFISKLDQQDLNTGLFGNLQHSTLEPRQHLTATGLISTIPFHFLHCNYGANDLEFELQFVITSNSLYIFSQVVI